MCNQINLCNRDIGTDVPVGLLQYTVENKSPHGRHDAGNERKSIGMNPPLATANKFKFKLIYVVTIAAND